MIYLNENDILLFQGDSITHGGRVYSDWDMNHIMGHGYQASLAGRLSLENLQRHPVILNRGISGDTTQSIINRIDADLLALKPTILSLLIGINDCYSDDRPEQPEIFKQNLETILNTVSTNLPDCKLILCEPFAFEKPSYQDEAEKQKIHDRIRRCFICAEYVKQACRQYNAVFVPFYDVLKSYVDTNPPASVIWDGVHPTFTGHEIMYRQWYKTVERDFELSASSHRE